MRGFTIISSLLMVLGCAGQTPAPQTPASAEPTPASAAPTPATAEPKSAEAAATAGEVKPGSLDVGMEFKDKGDEANRRANHDAPPTSAWKPVEKEKAIDPKKGSATAVR